jgi:hypothetical protein
MHYNIPSAMCNIGIDLFSSLTSEIACVPVNTVAHHRAGSVSSDRELQCLVESSMDENDASSAKPMVVSGRLLSSAGLFLLICCTMAGSDLPSTRIAGLIGILVFGTFLLVVGWWLELTKRN